MSSQDLRCALFGGVRIWRGDIELELGPPKQRATLGLLLAAAGRPVTVGQLIDALWGDQPAATAVNQIHRYIGALRRLFEPDIPTRAVGQWLLPVGAGYRLAAPSDLRRFRALVDEAHTATSDEAAQQLLAEALQLADGPPGDEAQRGLAIMVAIDDERVRAALLAAQHAIALGDVTNVVPCLRTIAAEHMLDEPLQAALIRCLHTAGRPAEALAVYARTREVLRDELGADPGADLTDAHQSALAGPAPVSRTVVPVHHPMSAPAQLPAATPSFVGREDAMAAISAGGGVTVISGMAGVGKTTLALHWAHTHAAEFPDGQLYVNLRGFDATGRAVEPIDALHDLLRSLGVAPAALPDDVQTSGSLLRTLLTTRRLIIVLDNARDARRVEPLLPGRTESRMIVTSRNRLGTLVARAVASLVDLEPFTGDEATEFLAQRLGVTRTSHALFAVQRLSDACGGLPLALAIVAARGLLNPTFSLDLLANEMVDSVTPLDLVVDEDREVDLREVLNWSYRALSVDAASALRALAVHPGPEISMAAAISLVGLPEARTRTALTALATASLLRETAPGRFGYHDLVRRYALEQPATDLATTTGRLFDHYVHSTHAACLQHGRPPLASPSPPAPRVRPESPTGIAGTIDWYRRERAVLQSTVRRAAELGEHRVVLSITQDWRPMSDNVDAPRDLLPYIRIALDAATSLESGGRDVPLTLIAECYRYAGAKFARVDDMDTARSHYDAALRRFERIGDLTGQANTLRNMAITLASGADERVALAARAVQVARRCAIPLVLCTALSAYGHMLRLAGRLQEAFPVLMEALALAQQNPGSDVIVAELLVGLAQNHRAVGDPVNAVAHGERAMEILHRIRNVATELHLLPDYGDALLAAGHVDRARRAWERYLSLSAKVGVVESVAQEFDRPAADVAADIRAKLALLPSDDDT